MTNQPQNQNGDRPKMGLPGPSKTIIVEPVTMPQTTPIPVPVREPVPA